jgi:hypothetical protein
VVQTCANIALTGSAGTGGVQRRIQHHFGLLERRQVMQGAQALEAAHIPRQRHVAEASTHAPVELQHGQEALRSVLMPITAGLCLLRVGGRRVEGARERPRAAGRVGVQPPVGVDGEGRRLLDGRHGDIAGRLEDGTPLAADPGDERGSVCVVMTPPGLPLLAAPPWRATP